MKFEFHENVIQTIYKLSIFYTDTGKMNWIDEAKVTDQDWRGRFSLTAIFCEWISTGLINYIFSKRCQLFVYYVNTYIFL